MKNLKNIIIIIIFIILASANSKEAKAQEQSRTMTIVPPAVQQSLNPGDRTEGKMKIINDSSEPLSFRIDIRDYIVVDTIGTPNFLPPNTLNKKYSASSWIAVFPTTFTIQPHDKQELMYYLQVPADARPGGHYAGSVYSALNTDSPERAGTSVQTQIGTLFYVDVAGPIREQSLVSKFITDSFSEYGPVKILTQIVNLGDLHTTPKGTIAVYDMLGRNIQTEKLLEYNVFPTAARDFENTFGQKFMIGRFEAKLLASYGKQNNLPLLATITFWVFPWKVTLIIILLIIAVVLGMKYWKKSKGTKQIKEENNVTSQIENPKA